MYACAFLRLASAIRHPHTAVTASVLQGDAPVHDGSLMTEEERDEGKVNWRVYWAYIRDGGVALSVLTVLSVCGGEAMSQLQQVRQPTPLPETLILPLRGAEDGVHED